MDDFKIAAHRGGNSMESLRCSMEKGFDFAELDVHLTRDNIVVVQYSSKVKINGEEVYIQDIRYSSLSEHEQKELLLLSEVLNAARGKIGIVIDIKRGRDFYPDIGRYVAKTVKELDSLNSVWLISFDHRCLTEAKQFEPNIQIAPMYVARLNGEEFYWKNVNADGVEVCTDYMCIETAKSARRNALTLIGWCAKNCEELEALLAYHTDIITIEINDLKSMEYLLERKGKSSCFTLIPDVS